MYMARTAEFWAKSGKKNDKQRFIHLSIMTAYHIIIQVTEQGFMFNNLVANCQT